MNEGSTERVTREQVVAAYKQFTSGPNVIDPAEIPDTPEGKEADRLYFAWIEQGDDDVVGNEEAWHLHNLDKTIVRVDAGFVGTWYLECAISWITQDNVDAAAIEDEHVRARIKVRIQESRDRLEILLEQSRPAPPKELPPDHPMYPRPFVQ